jgi:hypothetical protein
MKTTQPDRIVPFDDAESRFWEEKAAKQRAEAAKRPPVERPNFSAILKENEEKRIEAQKQATPTEDPHAIRNHLLSGPLHLPNNDPAVHKAKWEHFHPGQ